MGQASTTGSKGLTCCIEPQLRKVNGVQARCKMVSMLNHRDSITNKRLPLSLSEYALKLGDKNLLVNDDIRKWIKIIDVNSVRVLELSFDKKSYLLINSKIKAATGLASNFFSWVIIDATAGKVIGANLLSLSNDNGAAFIKNGELHFILFEFSEDFIREKDYENVSLAVVNYQFTGDQFRSEHQNRINCHCH